MTVLGLEPLSTRTDSPAKTSLLVCAIRILRSLAHIRHIFALPIAPDPTTKDSLSRWFETFLSILGVEVRTLGTFPLSTACLIVPNHVSWLDIMVIRSLFSTCFIAKEEILAWPLVGPMARKAGTIFIGRNSLSSFRETLASSRLALGQNIPITVFPEGTTTTGDRLLPFKTGVFDLCTETGYPALPVSIRYESSDGRQLSSISYTGDENFFGSFWRTLREPRVVVRVFISSLVVPHGKDRKEMATTAQKEVAEGLDFLAATGRSGSS